MTKVLLVGNQNSGKTTLFNALTGSNQRVGNWAGVTVEKQTSPIKNATSISITDLPGIYTVTNSAHLSLDQRITNGALLEPTVDLIINVVNACHLERNLYLTRQLLALKKPLIVAITMADLALLRGITLDPQSLSEQLGCPVVVVQANQGIGLSALQALLVTTRVPNDKPSIDPHKVTQVVQHTQSNTKIWFSEKLDRLVLHRFWAIPLFLAIMYSMFYVTFQIGGFFQEIFNEISNLIYVTGAETYLQQIHAPQWLSSICVNGIGKGINTTVTFIPVMAIMFFCLQLLESSGYMARVVFIMDRVMRSLGLSGQAFVPMILGFGCNVPAIMATRTLDSERERLLTILISPFMSCSARLAIYTTIVAMFFPKGGQNIIFSLYCLGILVAILTGLLLRKSVLSGAMAPLFLELPVYHKPNIYLLLKDTFNKVLAFTMRVGKWVLPVCVIFAVLQGLTINGDSIIFWLGQVVTPLFSPMGLQLENWPATVSLLMGVLAKEVVIGSLNTLYAYVDPVTQGVSQYFANSASAYAYLIFTLLYIPCISTMAVIRQETNRNVMIFSTVWSLIVAYATAVLIYQTLTISTHPQTTLLWDLIIFVCLGGVFLSLRLVSDKLGFLRNATTICQTAACGSVCGGCSSRKNTVSG